ncbi:MAG: FAD-dependent oxidoreductase [Pseudomonadota bacterium]
MNVAVQIDETRALENGALHENPIVVVGGGPVGTRAAQELSRRGYHVVLINAERWRPYNRVKLTPLLAGEAPLWQIYMNDRFQGPGTVRRYDNVAVVDVNRDDKKILLSNERVIGYEKLVLALGSRAFVPGIPGAGLSGVYVFRDFNDTEALIARSFSARNVVVIGGGLLGLEAARGMMKRGAKVTVVEHENRLMPRQLDLAAAEILKERIEEIGIKVVTGEPVQSINGKDRVTSVSLVKSGEVDADTVIICTGVRANTQLAAGIDLSHNRGILVDEAMRTTDENIYAVGECAERDGQVYGLVGPGYDQAVVAASHIAGEKPAPYAGSIPATKLKVLGADVFSMGDFENIEQQLEVKSYTFVEKETGIYRRIFVDRGRLVAALGVGEWAEATKVQQAVSRNQSVAFWNISRFKAKGILWRENNDGVSAWSKDAILCNCTGTTKGALVDAMTLGATTLDEIQGATSASTVCGTCKPLVMELIGEGALKPEPARWWKALLLISSLAALGALATLFFPRIPAPGSYITDDFWFNLWFDSIWKQYSGYTLLGLTVAAAMIGLRKRIRLRWYLGGYDYWRFVHLVIGIASVFVLVWHTGFRIGDNLNLALMASFLATLVFGALAGLVTGGEHELQERGYTTAASKPRSVPMWLHVLALWPLPVLLIIHILTVYSF